MPHILLIHSLSFTTLWDHFPLQWDI